MSTKVTYLYLDDNDKITRDGDVELLNNISTRINIETDYPSSWKQRAKSIFDDLKKIDGIILDWEFTNKSEVAKQGSAQAEDVDYSAESLAEHLRISVVQAGIKDLPIILCSADKNKAFSKTIERELTSRDLFDLTFIKNDLFVKRVHESESKLFDLATVYKRLQTYPFTITECLAIGNDEIELLDIRFVDTLENIAVSKTTHDLVRFLLREFIFNEGPLINSLVLAARLGVDVERSGENWKVLVEILHNEGVVYSGFFAGGWKRYWAFKLLNWWSKHFQAVDLRSTSGPKRVELLNNKFGLKLIAAEKLKFASSEEFWTVCYATKKPIDPINGFLIGDNNCSPWLEMKCVSAIGELEKVDPNAWRINVIDRERFNRFKAMIVTKD